MKTATLIALVTLTITGSAEAAKKSYLCERNSIPVDGSHDIALFESLENDQKNIIIAQETNSMKGYSSEVIEVLSADCAKGHHPKKLVCERDDRPVDGALERVSFDPASNDGAGLKYSSNAVNMMGEKFTKNRSYDLSNADCRVISEQEVTEVLKRIREIEKNGQKLKAQKNATPDSEDFEEQSAGSAQ